MPEFAQKTRCYARTVEDNHVWIAKSHEGMHGGDPEAWPDYEEELFDCLDRIAATTFTDFEATQSKSTTFSKPIEIPSHDHVIVGFTFASMCISDGETNNGKNFVKINVCLSILPKNDTELIARYANLVGNWQDEDFENISNLQIAWSVKGMKNLLKKHYTETP